MSNIFPTGKVASGNQFIGRERLVNDIFKHIYSDCHNVAMVGLPRIGKTSIAYRVLSMITAKIEATHEKTLPIMIDLGKEETFESFWCTIIERLYNMVSEMGLTHPQLEKEHIFFSKAQFPLEYQPTMIHAETFLQRLKKMGIRVILIVDEFDAAVIKFHGERHYYEFFRDIASTAPYSVTMMLISRQLIKRIEANAYGNSTLFGILDPITIRGFDNETDYPEYIEKLNENGYFLDKDGYAQLDNIAGRNPFLLCILGDRLLDASAAGSIEVTPEAVYTNGKIQILSYFDALMHQMENDGNLSRVMQAVIGPRYDITKDDIDTLFEMGYLHERPKSDYWATVSQEFSIYLESRGKNQDIWKELTEAQRILQELVRDNLPRLLGEKTEQIRTPREFNDMLERNRILDDQIYKNYVRVNAERYNVETTYVDVASIEKLAFVMERYWEDSDYGFRYIFGNQPYSAWKECFHRLYLSRNPCAHAHPEYLTKEDIVKTNMFCKRIKEVFEILQHA